MDEEDINSKFEELLCDINLDNNKRSLLRYSSMDYKDRMLQLRDKLADEIKENQQFKDPKDYIDYLEQCFEVDSQNPEKILDHLASLRIALTNYPLQWCKEFGQKGIAALCDVFKRAKAFNSDENFEKIQIEVIKCITKFASNIEGVQEILRSKSSVIGTIVTSIDYEKLDTAKVTFKLLITLLTQPELKEYVTKIFLRTLTDLSENKNIERFKIIVDGMLLTETEEIWEYCLLLIITILYNTKNVEDRIPLENEILHRCGLKQKIDTLRRSSHIEQLMRTFDRQIIEDELEFELKIQQMV